MAVVSSRRSGADRVPKDKALQPRRQQDSFYAKAMSFPLPARTARHGDQELVPSPVLSEGLTVSLGASERDALKKKKASRSKTMPSDLRRSASTPHLAGEPGALSPSEQKKRNKLGYHRTSIACSHCRRRKIRCQLPDPEDTNGRCTNCIRLKKECNFYPVDQTPEPSTGPIPKRVVTSSSSHSSPRISIASLPGSIPDEFHSHLSSPQPDGQTQQLRHEKSVLNIAAVSEVDPQPTPFAFEGPIGSSYTASPQPVEHFVNRQPYGEQTYWSGHNTPASAQFSSGPGLQYTVSAPAAYASSEFVPSRPMSTEMAQHYNYQGYHYNQGFPVLQQPQYGPDSNIVHSAPVIHAAPTSSGHSMPTVLASSFYPPQQAYHFDNREDMGYIQQQYYPHVTHPG